MDIKKTLSALKAQKLYLMSTKRDCYNFTMPLRGVGYNNYGQSFSQDSNVSTANAYKANKYDATATDASKILASFIVSGIAPSNLQWFDFDVAQDPTIRNQWLGDAASLIWREIHAGNFNSSLYECILDLVIGGEGILFQDLKKEGLHFELWDTSQCYFACSVKGGVVDSVYREYTLTPQQAMVEFSQEGDMPLPDRVMQASPDAKINFIHAIYPRVNGVYDGPAKNKPFASCHILVDDGVEIRQSGYDEFPLAIPRWNVIPDSPYAFGPVYEALDDIKTLNETAKFILQNAEMAICGMYGAVDDGVMNTGSITVGPRKVFIMAERDNMWPMSSGGDFNISEMMLQQQREQVRRSMMVDQLQIPQQQGTTATEINTRMQLLRQITGPVFGRLEEFLQALVFRSFGLLYRAGKLPQMPQELADLKQLSIRYVSPLARSQRNSEVEVIESYEMSIGQTMAVDPSIGDVYNWTEGAREKARLRGVPERLMNSNSQIRKIQEGRQQAQAQAQQEAVETEKEINESKKAPKE